MNAKEIVEAISDAQELGLKVNFKTVEGQINEHTNSKLNKIVKEIESLKKTKDNFDSKSYNLTVDVAINVALDAVIKIIKREITKKD